MIYMLLLKRAAKIFYLVSNLKMKCGELDGPHFQKTKFDMLLLNSMLNQEVKLLFCISLNDYNANTCAYNAV